MEEAATLNSSVSIRQALFSSLQETFRKNLVMDHVTVVYLVAKPLIWSEAEADHVVIETSI